MKKIFILLIFQLAGIAFIFSQQTIKGVVVNAITKEPVAGASVFLNNTSFGTATDKNGHFELNNLPAGRRELVVSSIGFNTYVIGFTSEELPKEIKVDLVVKTKELENVIVEPFVEEGWDKWGKVFTSNFIGTTPNGLRCSIKNYKAIRFRFYKKSNRLIAYCDEPLVIENKGLGYNVTYQMEDFEINFNERSTSYAGYPFFVDIDKKRKGLLNRWHEARDKAYYGSMIHFMQSIYRNSFNNDGYLVRRMKKVPNLEKERVRKIYKPYALFKDSTEYYERIMAQKDELEIYSPYYVTGDSLVLQTQGEYKFVYFPDYLYVTYKKEVEDRAYLESQTFSEPRKPTFQSSIIFLLEEEPLTIDVNGNYFSPRNVMARGYWSWSEKIGDMLPSDYEPVKPPPPLPSR